MLVLSSNTRNELLSNDLYVFSASYLEGISQVPVLVDGRSQFTTISFCYSLGKVFLTHSATRTINTKSI